MKAKISKNKKTKEITIDYFKVDDKRSFRFNLLKKVLENLETDATLVFDTNQLNKDISNAEIHRILDKACVEYTSFQIQENSTLFLGIKLDFIKRKIDKTQELFLIDTEPWGLNQSLFNELFQYADLAFGIGRNKTAQEINDIFKTFPSERILFNKNFFKHSLYDSIVCTSLRSSIDIQKFVKDIDL